MLEKVLHHWRKSEKSLDVTVALIPLRACNAILKSFNSERIPLWTRANISLAHILLFAFPNSHISIEVFAKCVRVRFSSSASALVLKIGGHPRWELGPVPALSAAFLNKEERILVTRAPFVDEDCLVWIWPSETPPTSLLFQSDGLTNRMTTKKLLCKHFNLPRCLFDLAGPWL